MKTAVIDVFFSSDNIIYYAAYTFTGKIVNFCILARNPFIIIRIYTIQGVIL